MIDIADRGDKGIHFPRSGCDGPTYTTLDYLDSSGIGMLVSCLTNVGKAGGELSVAGANPRLQRIFSMTGVDGMMPMFATLAEATA